SAAGGGLAALVDQGLEITPVQKAKQEFQLSPGNPQPFRQVRRVRRQGRKISPKRMVPRRLRCPELPGRGRSDGIIAIVVGEVVHDHTGGTHELDPDRRFLLPLPPWQARSPTLPQPPGGGK